LYFHPKSQTSPPPPSLFVKKNLLTFHALIA
jgi:hypothetical protein